MKTKQKILAVCVAAISTSLTPLWAQLSIPSDGSDGALIITTNTVIDLSKAVNGTWSDSNTVVNIGKGVYDPNKWAVVFKYSSVSIASDTTVTFKNHSTHAPVVWLVKGNVTINGWLSLDSESGGAVSYDNSRVLEPGPGGFRGGARYQDDLDEGSGFGPGGSHQDYGNAHGDYATGSLPYGNPQILPLIGGSGGSGWGGDGQVNGGAGGGAILIATSGTLSVASSGKISADGVNNHSGYYGSGGAIRLIADQITGSGRVEATSGAYVGRIRFEANTASSSLSVNPPTVAVSPTPLLIWPDPSAPTVKVISVAGQSAPPDPKAGLSSGGDDLTIGNSSSVNIILQTSNFPTNGTVNVLIKPLHGVQSALQASYVSGNTNLATWQLATTLPVSHAVIQARAVAN